MSIDLAVWRWNDDAPLPDDIHALHAGFDQGQPHASMARFDAAAFEEALTGLYERLPDRQGGHGWSYELVDPGEGQPNWVRLQVDIGLIQLFAPRLVDIAVVHELVVSDPHNDHIIGA